MRSKVCLAIIYNHNFEKNISVLNRVYATRFQHVYHIMPFYRGNDPHVIAVYENSYQFNGYISQAGKILQAEDFTHFVFVADDMVLNPRLNEENVTHELKIDRRNCGFISNFRLIDDHWLMSWNHGLFSFMNLMSSGNSCEGFRFVPPIDVARNQFSKHGLDWRKGVSKRLLDIAWKGCRLSHNMSALGPFLPGFSLLRKYYRCVSSSDKVFPMAMGYSDFIAITADIFPEFCFMSGIFAAKRVFVECAMPTSLILTCEHIETLETLGLKAENGVDNYKCRLRLEEETQLDYSRLVEEFPVDFLYIHPVKLSKWRNLP